MRTHRYSLAVLLVVAAGCANDSNKGTSPVAPGTVATTVADPASSSATSGDASDATTDTTPSEATIPQTMPTNPFDPESQPTVSTPPIPSPPLYEDGDIDPGLQPFIDQATSDLATRLDVDPATISTRAAVLVVWPDGSLGCPLPDMSYAQVPTDGSIIELEHDGQIYRYHTGGNRGPFTCDTPLTKAPPTGDVTLDTGDDT